MKPNTNYLKSENNNKDLFVIKDLSLFEKEYDEKLDSFHHKAYAETLVKLIESNEPPLSIGLFGPWGTGKSTILNIVNSLVENKDFIYVYFNAWKFAGDSFRRQFLLNAVEKLFCKEEKEKALREVKIHFHREIPVTGHSFKKRYSQVQKWLPKINLFGTLLFSFPMLETDPKLVLPEQFEEEFKNIINPQNLKKKGYPKTSKKISDKNFLFIIDDIDRCPPEMIITILDSVKTFLTPENLKCFFILALDDKAAVTALRKRNKSYSDEELLKFFDVTVRMNPLKKHDLVFFANRVAEQSKLPESVIQIAVYGSFDTPRKIKHFLNTFLVRRDVAKKRLEEGFLIEKPDLNQLSKLLVIETKFPQSYEKIIEDSGLIETLQEYSEKFHSGKKEEIPKDFRNLSDLYKFLWATRSITIDNPEMLIYLKLSQSANVLKKDGVKIEELTSAIDRFTLDKLSELIKPIQSEKSQKSLVDFIKEELEPATELFLENKTASALYIFENLEFNESSRKELCRTIAQDYIKGGVNIFNLPDVELLFKCVNLLIDQKRWHKSLKSIGLTVLEGMKEPQKLRKEQLLNVSKFIKNLYLKQLIEVKTSMRINTTLKGWIESPEQLIDVLENIKMSKNDLDERAKKGNLIPNSDVIKPLIDKISIKEEEVPLYERIRKIVFRFWQDDYLELIGEKLNFILTDRVPQVTDPTPEIKFALKTIIGLPAWLDKKTAFPIAQQIWNFYTKCPNPDDKILSLKAYLTSTYSIPDKGQKNSLREQFLGQLHALNPDQYKNILNFIKEHSKSNNWWGDLEKDFIIAIFNLVNKNLNNPPLAIPQIEFVWKKGIKFLDINQVTTLFKALLNHSTVNDGAFSQWQETITNFVPRINKKEDGFLAEFCNDLYTQITNLSVSPPISDIRRKAYLIVLTTLTKTSGNKSLRINMGQQLMSLLLRSESVLQNIGIESLPVTQEILDKDFGLYLSSSVKELCNKSVNDITAFQQPILKTVEFQKKWDPDALNRFSDMVLRCLTNPESSIQNMAGIFLKKVHKLTRDKKKKDITRVIINLCSESSENKKIWELILSSKKNILIRKLVDEYFKKEK